MYRITYGYFGVKVRVRISFRVRVLGNSDYCVLKFICVPRYKKIPMTSCTGSLISMFGTRMCGQTLLFIVIANGAIEASQAKTMQTGKMTKRFSDMKARKMKLK